MTTSVSLQSDHLRCDLRPDLGGCIAGLWFDAIPVVRSSAAQDLRSVRDAGAFAMVPFSNRMAHATLQWAGTSHPLVQNKADEPHAIHGVGWARPWDLLQADADVALMSYEHKPDATWPFAFDASQAFRMHGNELELTLGITNQSGQAAPVGLGWHPHFVKRARSRIAFAASGRWEMDAQKLPTRRVPSSGLDAECRFLDVDHCFDGWGGVVQLRDELLHTRISSSLTRLVVYSNDRLDTLAIEPVSHVNNAINLSEAGSAAQQDLGVRVLQPGESMSAVMGIRVEAVK